MTPLRGPSHPIDLARLAIRAQLLILERARRTVIEREPKDPVPRDLALGILAGALR